MTNIYSMLEISRGLKSDALYPGDVNSAEQIYETINLLAGVGGIAIEEWTPKYPALKGGGTYADSPIADGKQLIASAYDNVIEAFTVVVASLNLDTRAALLSKLMRFGRNTENFWTGGGTEPVVLGWKLDNAKVPQYARLVKIEIAGQDNVHNVLVPWKFTITVEREPAWNILVPHGGNPKMWSFYAANNNVSPGVDYDYTDLSLISGTTDHLMYQVIQNAHEFAANGLTRTTQNFVTIPAASIPGDAPALVCIQMLPEQSGVTTFQSLFVGKSTTPLTNKMRSGTIRARSFSLNAGDTSGTGGGVTSATDADGLLSRLNPVNRKLLPFTITTTNTGVASWVAEADLHLWRGAYQVFARMWHSGGVDGDIKVSMDITEYASANGFAELRTQESPAPTGGSNRWVLVPLGQIKLPLGSNAVVAPDGRGAYVSDHVSGVNDLRFQLRLRNTKATSVSGEVSDLIFLPIDDGSLQLMNENGGDTPGAIIDGTGYMTHGRDGIAGYVYDGTANNPFNAELRGSDLTLTPGVDNHLVFILQQTAVSANVLLKPMTVRINIIPRCFGIASV